MKIGILVRFLQPSGVQKTAIYEAKKLQEEGKEVILYFIKKSGSKYNYEDLLKGLDYRVLYTSDYKSLMTPIYDYITGLYLPDRKGEKRLDYDLLKKFYKHIKADNINFLVCHDQWAGYAGYICNKKLGVPYSVIIHECLGATDFKRIPILDRVINKRESQALNCAISVHCITKRILLSFERKYPWIKNKGVYNIQGMDFSNGKALTYSERNNSIIIASMWDEKRRPDKYIKIAQNTKNFDFYIIGNFRDSKLELEFEKEANKVSNIHRLKNISENHLIEIYKKAKFTIRFGYGECGIGTSFIEAVNSRTPLIINDGLGTSNLITEEGGGIVVKNEDDVPKIISRFDNEEDYSKLQKELEFIRNKYTWKKHCDLIIHEKE